MKQLITFQPAFNPTAQTLDFTSYQPGFSINKLYAVIDVTTNTPIYIAGAPGLGVTAVNGSVITLAYATGSLGSTDKLNIYYDTGSGFETNTPSWPGRWTRQLAAGVRASSSQRGASYLR